VKILTLVALIFVPLSFTSGLFSMGDDYLPGRDQFWVFFAVAIPLIILIFAIAELIDLGHGRDGVWSGQNYARRVKDWVARLGQRLKRGTTEHDFGDTSSFATR
jgi:hypothetical protein